MLDRSALTHPALTGMTHAELNDPTALLAADQRAQRRHDHTTRRDGGPRLRAPGGGRK